MIENLLLPVNFVMTLDPFAALPALGVFGGLAFCMMFLDLIRINIKPPTYFFLGSVVSLISVAVYFALAAHK